MHRCSSSQGNMVGPCSCDLFHYHHNQYQHHHSHSYSSISSSSSPPSPFSMLFSKPYDLDHDDHHDQHDHDHQSSLYSFGINSGVDCTLSLGTPSTRLCSNDDVYNKNNNNDDVEVKRSSSRSDQRRSVSNFCWDLLQPKHYSAQTTSSQHKNGPRGGANNNNNNGNSNDPLVARRCANCDTTSTPLWRNGPRGPKSLCNACGIRFKKEERRASAAAATPAPSDHSPASHVYGHQYQYQYHQSQNNINPWNNVTHYSQPQKVFSATNELRFVESSAEDDVVSAETGISFLSWRLNVSADRPSLVHDFTR